MPLEERTIVDIREDMALAALGAGATVTEVAIRFGVSRPTVRLWRERYRKEGQSGLEDHSHATTNCPHRTHPAIEEVIVEERERWGFGSKKLLQRLTEAYPRHRVPRAFHGRYDPGAPRDGGGEDGEATSAGTGSRDRTVPSE